MLQMLMKSCDKEQVLDLVDVPEFVLLQFCDVIIRRWDLRNPDAQRMLRETVKALKLKSEEAPIDQPTFNRHILKEQIAQIEDVLKQFDQE